MDSWDGGCNYYEYVQDVDSPIGSARLFKYFLFMTGDHPGVYLNYMMLIKVDGNKYIEFNVDQGRYSNWDGAEITELGITAA